MTKRKAKKQSVNWLDADFTINAPKPTPRHDEGVKYDEGKPAWDLLPYDALEDVADVLTYGASKYARRNWEKGMDWGRLLRASVGHLAKFMMGEANDTESGKHHLAHAAADVLFVLAYFKRKVGTDDRSKRTAG